MIYKEFTYTIKNDIKVIYIYGKLHMIVMKYIIYKP